MSNVFEVLSAINVNDHVEERNGFKYLSWPWAWAEVKKRYPDAQFEVYKNKDDLPYAFDPKTGYMVYTKVTIDGLTHEMWLPVMDSANKAMTDEPYTYRVKNNNFKYAKKDSNGVWRDKYGNEQAEYLEKTCEKALSTDINKAVMRCLTKNIAMFGLGLYLYAGTDLPESEEKDGAEKSKTITEEQHNAFLELIRDSYDNGAARNNAYKSILSEFGLTPTTAMAMTVDVYDKVMSRLAGRAKR
ncbi:MAG: DUF1071 domain-containing protein [Lachnospiraceae bacterium]|nr:DUF1071 domain-containing protein [Lachnospiraceae bacterium]